jgi:membrane associated rhomboid family serine protease
MAAAETRVRSAERRDERFLLLGAVVGVVGCLLATATPLVAGAGAAFTGSVVTSGLLGTVFAVQNLRLFRRDGAVALAPAVLTVLFGVWFMLAPLLYDVGFLATAGTQLAGLLVATFAGYMVVARIAPVR